MPDTADIVDIFSVDVTLLASIYTFGIHVTTCPDLSVAVSVSVDPGTYYTSAADTGAYLSSIRNPSLAPNMGCASLGDVASGTLPLMALGGYAELDDSLAQGKTSFGPVLLREIEVLVLALIFH